MLEALLIIAPFILAYTVVAVYAERKVSAFIQDRLGPMEAGRYGIGQTVADLLKLIQKEDIVPAAADRWLFKLAPVIIFTAVFSGFAVMPIGPGLIGSHASTGVFLLLAIISLDVLGILMAGWGSNNKFSLYGAMRSVAQIISYEIPLGLAVLAVVMIAQSLNLEVISFQQGIHAAQVGTTNYLFGLQFTGIDLTQTGGFMTWNIFRVPVLTVAFVVFFISSLAEANRAPFDLPEAESELIGGYHTEYTGFRWAMLMLAEYGMMLLVSLLAAVLFLGSWNTPLPNIGPLPLASLTTGEPGTLAGWLWGAFWLLGKAFFLIFVQMWVRWTYPRLRVDQLMSLCWKYLIPLSLLVIMFCGVWRLFMF
jgi:NADH-quinone oxidoreductase subunit H